MTRARGVARVLAAVCAAALAATAALAIEQRAAVVAGGAQESSGGGRRLVGTVGQVATGASSSGAFVLCSGYWCLSGAALVSVDSGPGGVSPAGLPGRLELGPISPQPSRGPVRFAIGLPHDADLRFEVFDVSGRALGEPVQRRLRAGRHALEWALRGQPAGVYFARIAVDGVVRAHRRVVIVP